MIRILLKTAMLLVLFAANLMAVVINVPADYTTIQSAIIASNDNDSIIVADGIYSEHINFEGKPIYIGSVNGNIGTFIEGTDVDIPIVEFSNNETSASILDGFTISGANGAPGILISHSSPVVKNNYITNNHGGGGSANEGGGIYCDSSSALIRGNYIVANSANSGGAISGWYSSAIIDSNIITGNSASSWSGGIRFIYSANQQISYNVVFNNAAFITTLSIITSRRTLVR